MKRAQRYSRWAVATGLVVVALIVLPLTILNPVAQPYWTERNAQTAAPTTTVPNWVELAKAAKPAVVNITTKFAAEKGTPSLEELFRNVPPQGRQPLRGRGSGFIINRDGHIVTNNHVVDEAASVQVKLSDGREFSAKVVGKDPKTDLALLKIDDGGNLPVLPLGDSAALQVGEPIMAIGNPFGLELTVTTGIVSATGRLIGSGPYDDFIQTDASINPGNSGGPLINARGEAVGISTAIFSRTGGSIGIGFAVPINMAKFVVPQLVQHGRVVRGWLGVTIQPLTAELARSFGLPETEGALVSNVQDGSPAAKAGLKSGDVIVEFDGKKITRTMDLSRIVAATPVDKEVRLTVLRDGKPLPVTARIARLEDRSEAVASEKTEPGGRGKFGVTVEPVTAEMARELGLQKPQGVVVRQVRPGSPAADAGIRPGDVIAEVNRKPVHTVDELRLALEKQQPGTPALILVHREGASLYLTAKI
jgi:serine protease Do